MTKKSRRIIGLSITAIVVAALAVWMSVRWKVWFGIPDEPAYVAVKSPDRIMLTLGDSTELSRNISWQCGDVVQDAWVEIRSDVDSVARKVKAVGEVYQSRSGKAAFYCARLRDLEANRTYAYRVATGRQYSDWYSFSTPSEGEHDFSFLYVGDVQDTVGGKINAAIHEAVRRIPDLELFVSGGDLVERPADKYWNEAFAELDSIRQHIPVMCIAGNHDYLKTLPDSTERRFPLVFSYFLDSMVGDNLVATFNYGDVQFFLLDSNRYPYDLYTQSEWLEEKLSRSEAKWKVVVMHHPLYSLKKGNNLIQRWMFDDIVRKYNVDLVLQGHEHAYARMATNGSTPVYIVSHCSPKNYGIDQEGTYQVYGTTGCFCQRIQIRGDEMIITSYNAETHEQNDSIRISKDPLPTSPRRGVQTTVRG